MARTGTTRSSAPFNTRLLEQLSTSEKPPIPHPSSCEASHDVESLLPASFSTPCDDVLPTSRDVWGCIINELDLDRPRQIHHLLWLAGRQRRCRALHYQIIVSREIFIAEQMDMHLVRTRSQIFVKPLPRYLLEPKFWGKYLCCHDQCQCQNRDDPNVHGNTCDKIKYHKVALGFLVSYAALIRHESDLILAQQHRLVPQNISFSQWRLFTAEILTAVQGPEDIDPRFHYGELSLDRLSKLYRLIQPRIGGDYLVQWRHHSSFFLYRFQWLATVVVYMVLVLTAMQVGLATTYLSESKAFHTASYGFTVFSILGPIGVVVILALESCFVALRNGWGTLEYKRRTNKNKLGQLA
ncbi:hypothetical protein VFPPC_08324 [Pochonia chlamydosporia 170]|uniref:Subtilisin-like serine protease n=1 Tax=Pochonia chlamydosporia 170 TaxID=1380566 RepID=A0A179FMK5_METCM|nr:hypothetical protein VFPPC_08324 [Pochonia chlamydosporia 170]OAQ66812.1 hypothetical protein VFPPC_08324 [Pochonia chlamydosporia 170]